MALGDGHGALLEDECGYAYLLATKSFCLELRAMGTDERAKVLAWIALAMSFQGCGFKLLCLPGYLAPRLLIWTYS